LPDFLELAEDEGGSGHPPSILQSWLAWSLIYTRVLGGELGPATLGRGKYGAISSWWDFTRRGNNKTWKRRINAAET
jgi:hypothetical protein